MEIEICKKYPTYVKLKKTKNRKEIIFETMIHLEIKKYIYKTSIEKHLSDKGSTEIKHRAFSNDNKKYILKFRF